MKRGMRTQAVINLSADGVRALRIAAKRLGFSGLPSYFMYLHYKENPDKERAALAEAFRERHLKWRKDKGRRLS